MKENRAELPEIVSGIGGPRPLSEQAVPNLGPNLGLVQETLAYPGLANLTGHCIGFVRQHFPSPRGLQSPEFRLFRAL